MQITTKNNREYLIYEVINWPNEKVDKTVDKIKKMRPAIHLNCWTQMLKTMISACRHPIPQNDAASQRILLLPTHISGITLYRINYVIFHSLHNPNMIRHTVLGCWFWFTRAVSCAGTYLSCWLRENARFVNTNVCSLTDCGAIIAPPTGVCQEKILREYEFARIA